MEWTYTLEDKMKKNRFYAMCMMIIFVSFMGFFIEGVWMSITKGFFNNRNMHLPFLIGYGLGVILVDIMWGKPQAPHFCGNAFPFRNKFLKFVLYFVAVFFTVSITELILGHTMEAICGFYWWNYTYLPLHFTRYTSLPTGILFTSAISIFMGCCYDPLIHFFENKVNRVTKVIAAGIVILLICDFVYSTYCMYQMQNRNQLWKIYIEDIVSITTNYSIINA